VLAAAACAAAFSSPLAREARADDSSTINPAGVADATRRYNDFYEHYTPPRSDREVRAALDAYLRSQVPLDVGLVGTRPAPGPSPSADR
jgi:hypothetical protein